MAKKSKRKDRSSKPVLTTDRETDNILTNVDSFVNALSGFHGENDPMGVTSFLPTATNQTSSTQIENMYVRNWATRAIIDTFPEDATREGFTISCDNADVKKWLEEKLESLDVLGKSEEGMILGRLFGGSIMVVGALDGNSLDVPLNENNIAEIFKIEPLDRYQVIVNRDLNRKIGSAYGEPESYTAVNTQIKIHSSRVIRMDGDFLPARKKDANDGWNSSVLESVYEAIKYFDVAVHSGSLTLQDFITKVLQIPGLSGLLKKKGGEAAVRERVRQAFRQLSIFGVTVIQDTEKLSKVQNPVTGLPKLMEFFTKILSAASKIPQTRLFGEQLGTLAGADSTIRVYHDRVRKFQEKKFKPILKRIIDLLLLSKEAPAGAQAATYSIKFRSLWQMTLAEELNARKTQAEIDEIYIRNGVLDEDEVAMDRFGGPDEFSFDTTLRIPRILNEDPDEGDDIAITDPGGTPPGDVATTGGGEGPPTPEPPPASHNDDDIEEAENA